MKLFNPLLKQPTAEELREVPDDKLKFISTANLWSLALAELMEAEGVNDDPLIQELYRRGRAEK